MHARGDLAVGERFTHLSLLDTRFECFIAETASVAGMNAVIPNVSGRAWLTGVSYYGTDPEDPFPGGLSPQRHLVCLLRTDFHPPSFSSPLDWPLAVPLSSHSSEALKSSR